MSEKKCDNIAVVVCSLGGRLARLFTPTAVYMHDEYRVVATHFRPSLVFFRISRVASGVPGRPRSRNLSLASRRFLAVSSDEAGNQCTRQIPLNQTWPRNYCVNTTLCSVEAWFPFMGMHGRVVYELLDDIPKTLIRHWYQQVRVVLDVDAIIEGRLHMV